jgi:hypothetical protein
MDPRFIFAALAGVHCVALIFAAVTTVRHISALNAVASEMLPQSGDLMRIEPFLPQRWAAPSCCRIAGCSRQPHPKCAHSAKLSGVRTSPRSLATWRLREQA